MVTYSHQNLDVRQQYKHDKHRSAPDVRLGTGSRIHWLLILRLIKRPKRAGKPAVRWISAFVLIAATSDIWPSMGANNQVSFEAMTLSMRLSGISHISATMTYMACDNLGTQNDAAMPKA